MNSLCSKSNLVMTFSESKSRISDDPAIASTYSGACFSRYASYWRSQEKQNQPLEKLNSLEPKPNRALPEIQYLHLAI